MSPLRVRRPLVPLVAVLAVVAALGLAIVLREVVDPGGEDNANGSVAVRDVTDLRGTWTAVNDVGAPSPVVEGLTRFVGQSRLAFARQDWPWENPDYFFI